MPALPQHISGSAIQAARRPECRRGDRAAAGGRPVRGRDDTHRGRRPAAASGCRGASDGPSSTSSSVTSRTRAVNAAARAFHSGSSARSASYSFIDEPQPAALTTTRSTPATSNVAIDPAREVPRLIDRGRHEARARRNSPARPERSRRSLRPRARETVAIVHMSEDEPLHAAGEDARRSCAARSRRVCAPARSPSAIGPSPAARARPGPAGAAAAD